jgi:hypothetical protein
MRTFLDAEIMATALRTALDRQRVEISHTQAFEIVAAEFGFSRLHARLGTSLRREFPSLCAGVQRRAGPSSE